VETILDGYILVRESEPFNSRNVIADTFEQVARILRAVDVVRKRPTIETVISYGEGNWANVPWIAFLDDRETKTTQHGVYVIFLFKEDGTGVYVTYNQGVTDIIKAQGRQLGRERLQQLARERRLECAWLSERGFLLDDTISLSEDAGLVIPPGGSGLAIQHSTSIKGMRQV
jgi:5-methylcytosine-specific restriction protein B